MAAVSPQYLITRIIDRETAPFIAPDRPRANVTPAASHISLIVRKLIVVFVLIIFAAVGLSSTIIGALATARNCYAPKQPSAAVWLLIIGGMSCFLVTLLIVLICMSITCKYKSNDKQFRVAFTIIIFVASIGLIWSSRLGYKSAFDDLPITSIECLGFIFEYSLALHVFLSMSTVIYGGYMIYILIKRGAFKRIDKNRVNVAPIEPIATQPDVIEAVMVVPDTEQPDAKQPGMTQPVPLQNTSIEMTPTEYDSTIVSETIPLLMENFTD